MQRNEYPSGTVDIARIADAPGAAPCVGLDRLPNALELVRARRVGLFLNHTAVTSDGKAILDVLRVLGADVRVLFTPEHGLLGAEEAGKETADGTYRGIKALSLYGPKKAPAPEDLAGLDLCVFDIQDVACRFYTYITTMCMAMEKTAAAGLPFLVLDRPCLAGGTEVAGPVLAPACKSFVGYLPVPIAYGMTPGELAHMAVAEGWLGKGHALAIVPLGAWRRGAPADGARPFLPPSPNLPTLDAVIAYAGTCLLEATNVSEGRGLPAPFLTVGAPWIVGTTLAEDLARRALSGVSFRPAEFTPRPIAGKALAPKYAGERCEGVTLVIADRARFQSVRTGLELLSAVLARWPGKATINERSFKLLAGVEDLHVRLTRGEVPAKILAAYEPALADFRERRQRYLLYR